MTIWVLTRKLGTPTYNIDSDLDQSERTLASEINTQTIITSPSGTSDNPIRIESSPETIIETPPAETPKDHEPRPRRNPGPLNFLETGASYVKWP